MSIIKPAPTVIDKLVDFVESPTDGLSVVHKQEIPDSFVSTLKSEKMDSLHTPAGDFYRVASIPVSVVEDLKRHYNFDVMQEPASATLRMLKRLHMDGFITTSKSI